MRLVLEATAATIVAVFAMYCAKNWKKWKRRKGGWYIVITDHPRKRYRRHIGYVGETVSFRLRQRQHLGSSRFHPVTGVAKGNVMHKTKDQPWADLRPRWIEIPLPWWLCWKFLLRSGETLLIWILWPRYNIAKNKWNPRRITPGMAVAGRAKRDQGGVLDDLKVAGAHTSRWLVSGGTLAIVIGFVSYIMTR